MRYCVAVNGSVALDGRPDPDIAVAIRAEVLRVMPQSSACRTPLYHEFVASGRLPEPLRQRCRYRQRPIAHHGFFRMTTAPLPKLPSLATKPIWHPST